MNITFLPVMVDGDYGNRSKIACRLLDKKADFAYLDKNNVILPIEDLILNNKEFKWIKKGVRDSIINGIVVPNMKEYNTILELLSKCLNRYNKRILMEAYDLI